MKQNDCTKYVSCTFDCVTLRWCPFGIFWIQVSKLARSVYYGLDNGKGEWCPFGIRQHPSSKLTSIRVSHLVVLFILRSRCVHNTSLSSTWHNEKLCCQCCCHHGYQFLYYDDEYYYYYYFYYNLNVVYKIVLVLVQ
jgi:hypothetical protein